METIKFYGRTSNPKYWPFSNFYPAPFIDSGGTMWPTTEHYFQAMKFLPEAEAKVPGIGPAGYYVNNVRKYINKQSSPKLAAQEGRRRDLPLRKDWESIKNNIMFDAIRLKFTQHEVLKQLLLDTGDAIIIEDSPTDYYWGCGKDGSGKNMLGKLLMVLRTDISLDKDM